LSQIGIENKKSNFLKLLLANEMSGCIENVIDGLITSLGKILKSFFCCHVLEKEVK